MAEYKHSAHAIYDLKYHMIWCTKYLRKVLRGRIAERACDLICQICQAHEVVIVRGAISPNHITHAAGVADSGSAKPAQYIKGRSSRQSAGRISRAVQTVLGSAYAGARLLLRDGGRGG